MSLIVSIQSELLKTRRSASFWISILGAGFIPLIFLLSFYFKPDGAIKNLSAEPWQKYFGMGWQVLNSFIFPMYVILICTLIPQIEYRNNAWKQVFSSPQSFGTIYFSKFFTIHLMIFFFYLMFNVFMITAAIIINLINSKFPFLNHSIDWPELLKMNLKTYISILGISAIQYCISLRFKNFIVPIGIGLAFLVGAIVALNFNWEHIDKMPYAYPFGFLDMRFRKEKG